ncbi:MAG: NmrA family transcriptional regulator [Pseudanabaena sp.]|nr:MAG: NmrA family transcriptional regulator [Pseudanabaena sp.]
MKILIAGATGNVGMAVIKSLNKIPHSLHVIAGIRDFARDKQKLSDYKIDFVKFDFMDFATYSPALEGCQMLFLLRPPQISNTEKYFKPLIKIANEVSIKHIIFLSVQGVEKSTIIPHHKIEKLIMDSKVPYTMLRPAYFMQNFMGSLHHDLVINKRIFLPAGNARFTIVDVGDVGEVAAAIIVNPIKHINKSYELTNNEKLTFEEMATQLSDGLGTKITYESPNLFEFYWIKTKEKMPFMLIMVIIMLHYLPRFQKEPRNTECIKEVIGREPITFNQFIKNNKTSLIA